MLLTDKTVKAAKPTEKQYKLSDGKGLYLLVLPAGGKYWHFRTKSGGKDTTISFGTYPEITLAEAREKAQGARKHIAKGFHPVEVRKAEKAAKVDAAATTFEAITRQWYYQERHRWSDNHAQRLLRRLELDIFPAIGDRPLTSIKTPEMETILKRVAIRTLETAHRLKIACDMVYRYAIRKELTEYNPVAPLKGVLPTIKNTHMAAPTDPKDVAPLLRSIDGFEGSFIVKCAMQLAPLLFVRPGELRHAEWSEIDLEKAEWSIPAEKMKMKHPHLVPLPIQAVEILKSLHPLTSNSKYVFPCHRSPLRCMSENTVNAGLRRLGYEKTEITGHGFRAMARTMLHEILQFQPDAIEAQLAHAVPDRLGSAYNRTKHLPERKKMMQTWADYLDGLKTGAAKVIPMRRNG